MPRDKRLWMTFPIDFWSHPKIAPLSDAAFRAFVEMNGYSRMHKLDGEIPLAAAVRMWPSEVIDELVGSHETRPLLFSDGRFVVLRDYAEHQETVADEEARRRRNQVNGSKGGRPPKNPPETQPVSFPNPDVTETKADIDTDKEIEVSSPKTSPVGKGVQGGRASRIPDPFLLTTAMRDWAIQEVPNISIDAETRQFVDYWRAASGSKARKVDWVAAWRYWMRNTESRPRKKTPTERAAQTAAAGRAVAGRQVTSLDPKEIEP